jgi:hypothetical protein
VERDAATRTTSANGSANGKQLTSARGDDEMFVEDRLARRRRARLVGFGLCISLWVLSVVPLARESMDGRDNAVLVYLAVAALGLGIAAVLRGAFILLTKHRFWTPWVFVIAALVVLVGYSVQSAGEEVVPVASAAVESSAT